MKLIHGSLLLIVSCHFQILFLGVSCNSIPSNDPCVLVRCTGSTTCISLPDPESCKISSPECEQIAKCVPFPTAPQKRKLPALAMLLLGNNYPPPPPPAPDCEHTTCPAGQRCEMIVQVECLSPPCDPVPDCIPIPTTPSALIYGYKNFTFEITSGMKRP